MKEWIGNAFLKPHGGGWVRQESLGGHLEAQDDGPDQPQGQPVVPVHNVMRAHVLQVHTLLLQELQCLVHVFKRVDPHATARGSWLGRQGRWDMDGLAKSTVPSAPTRPKRPALQPCPQDVQAQATPL